MGRRKRKIITSATVRSAISNGSAILAGVDHRSAWMRRLRDLAQLHLSDLGGEQNTSEAEKILIRRCAMLSLQLEMMEQRFATNDGEATAPQLEAYQRGVNTLRRTLEALGLKRRPHDVTPSLRDYLKGGNRKRVTINGEVTR